MASRAAILLPIAVLILRLLTLGLLVASLAVVAADKLSVDSDYVLFQTSQKYTFRDFYAYRYVLAVAVIGCAYTLLQLPFAAVSIAGGNNNNKRATAAAAAATDSSGGRAAVALALVLVLVVVLADVVFTLLLATGAAAGFGFTVDAKRNLDVLLDDYFIQTPEVEKIHRDMDGFFELANASAGLMLGAAACMTLVIMLSVYSLATR